MTGNQGYTSPLHSRAGVIIAKNNSDEKPFLRDEKTAESGETKHQPTRVISMAATIH